MINGGSTPEQESALDGTAISSLSPERKAGLLSGLDFWQTEPIPELGVGSTVLADGTYGLRHQQGQSDHLALFASEPATCFPPGVAVGSSWDPTVAARLGTALGREALAQGVDVVLGPGVNIKRSPLCGRNFEYYSEDPLLAGVLGTAFTRGLQDEGPGVSVKHFAANNQETNRQTISSDVDERTLREIYLPAFERIVTDAAPATVMTAYNKINGVFCSENAWLLTDVLREEWGFKGLVLSDWNAVVDRVAALEAGLDLEMPGGDASHDEDLRMAMASGRLAPSTLDPSIARVVALARRPRRPRPDIDQDAHHELARDLARECAVLLKNDRTTLPLQPNTRLAIIGEFAETLRFQGGGSAHVHATRVDSPLEAIRDLAIEESVAVEYSPGFRTRGFSSPELLEHSIVVAGRADVTVVFAGLSEAAESEGIDRADIQLPIDQVELIRAVAAVSSRTVVVLSNGGIVSLEGWHDDVDAVLEGFLLGQGGGRALAEILFGRVNPSGRLAETIPLRLEDHPSSINFPGEQGHVRYGEGVLVGYRYFTTTATPTRYSFGHGLSYSTFDVTSPTLEQVGDDAATVTVTVTNTGTRAGKHVVQVYVATEAGPVRRPTRELRAFQKVELDAGESTTVRLELPRRSFAYWDIRHGRWLIAPGAHLVQIAADADTVLHELPLDLPGDVVITALTMDTPLGEWFEHPLVGDRVLRTLGFDTVEISPEHMAMMTSMTMTQFLAISGAPVPRNELDDIIADSHPS
ncbi:glycoside hydrolase family 3 C-terminal domain-containing protein [Clavibacter sp. VKM Ac-2873]|uniref:beta-glucosidase n=1 Tax=Clavibacter sp. VKM Ac-2873 TaxID=2783813 RepID=UPI00351C08DA